MRACAPRKHAHLRTLLLSGNLLSALPNELGLLATLSGLALAGNPLYYPPCEVVAQGRAAIQAFLRERLA